MAKGSKKITKKPTRAPVKKATPQRESKLWLYLLGLAGVLAVVAGGWYLSLNWQEARAKAKAEAAMYSAFGIVMPTNYRIHGIDVSKYQSVIAWNNVAAMNINNVQMEFAFIKCTEGVSDKDKRYAANIKAAREAGMYCGAYHFFNASKNGISQAKNFIANAGLQKGDLPPVVDVEQLNGVSPEIMRKRLKEYLATIQNIYHIKPIVYSYVDFYEQNLGAEFDNYPLWIAHYHEPGKPRIGRSWTFWQHSEEGHVNGITSNVDCDVFYGDAEDFKRILMK